MIDFIKEKLVNFLYSLAYSKLARLILRNKFRKLDETWNETTDDLDLFIQKNKEVLKKVEFSHSFSPEHQNFVYTFDEFKNKTKVSPLNCLKILTEDLNIKNVRLGIRWCDVDNDGEIDLSAYKSLIEYCLKNNLSICLNIGPIKTFRWPEVYIPEKYISKTESQFHIIDANSEISKLSIEYLNKLFEKCKKEFGESFFEKVKVVQPENEMFNPFGPREWIVSEDHVIEVSKVIKKYFPKSKILISVSGGPNKFNILNPDLFKAQKLSQKLQNIFDSEKIIIGLNYYYKIPGMPIDANGNMIDNFSLLKTTNGNRILENAFEFSKSNKQNLEISELQFENWGEVISPGTSLREFEFSLLRVLSDLNIKDYDKRFVIRLWGSELLAQRIASKTLNSDQYKIIELIKRIQAL